ncbi:methyltransferase-like protein 17, mitochondrial isoform X2 [Pseudophryne corroboree]|uniref:methyltransferase-like protein 17, mitochondrial isoform X2 n=1 Tax=Pseudophryne corroboree TaxID=495146 RepID=UPI003081451E
MLSLRLPFHQFRALSSSTSSVPQLDHAKDFLSRVPHRNHPGIIHMKTARLPQQAQDAAQVLLKRCTVRQLEESVASLNNYLWSRKRPIEDNELRGKAAELEHKLRATLQFDSELNSHQQEEKLKNQILNTLRKNTYHWQPLNYTNQFGLVYLAARFAAGFAAVSRVLQEISQRVPEFKPQTLMDFGSGIGSVSWAANAVWGNSLKEYVCVDASASMNTLSELLLKGGIETGHMHISGVHFRQFLPVSPKVQYDLVFSAYSLNELPSFTTRERTIQTLWRKTGGFLVLVENGTVEGHQLLMEARNIVLNRGDKQILDDRPPYVFAPNPPWRWEKFSFLILSRGSVDGNNDHWPRVIEPVLRRPRHVHCHTCGSDGKLHYDVITARRHGKDLYRCARRCQWGDRLPAIISNDNSLPDEPENGEEIPAS